MHCKDKLKRYVAVILILVMVIPLVTLESYGSDGKKNTAGRTGDRGRYY